MTEYVLFCLEVAMIAIFESIKYTWVKKSHDWENNVFLAQSEQYTMNWEYLVNN